MEAVILKKQVNKCHRYSQSYVGHISGQGFPNYLDGVCGVFVSGEWGGKGSVSNFCGLAMKAMDLT